MTEQEMVGFTKRQIRINKKAEAAVALAQRKANKLEQDLLEARTALASAKSELARINELGDLL